MQHYVASTQSQLFMTLKNMPFENVGKEENAGNHNFLLFPQRFLPNLKIINILSYLHMLNIAVCKSFQFGPV